MILRFFVRPTGDLNEQFYFGKTVYRIMMKHNLSLYKRRKVQDVRKASVALIVQYFTTDMTNRLPQNERPHLD